MTGLTSPVILVLKIFSPRKLPGLFVYRIPLYVTSFSQATAALIPSSLNSNS